MPFQVTTEEPWFYSVTVGPAEPEVSLGDGSPPESAQGVWYNRFVEDGHGELRIPVLLDEAATDPIAVSYSFGGTALQGTHYRVDSPRPLVITPGSESADIVLEILTVGSYFRARFLTVTLSALADGVVVGSTATFRVDIRPTVLAPSVDFNASTSTSLEDGGAHNIQVDLSAASVDDVEVYYEVSGGTAATDDYTLAPSPLRIPAGDTTGNIVITPVADAGVEGDETVVIDIINDSNAKAVSHWPYTTSLHRHEGTDWAGFPSSHVFVDGITEGENVLVVTAEGVDPRGVDVAYRFGVGPQATSWPYITQSAAMANGYSSSGALVGGRSLNYQIGLQETFSVYVKKPADPDHVATRFGVEFVDLTTGSRHYVHFSWSGTAPVLADSGSITGGGVLTSQWHDDGSDSNDWHRVWLRYAGVAGDAGNPFEVRLYPWVATGAATVGNSSGKGTLFAWPMLEESATTSQYQRLDAAYWEPWGGAYATGTLQHTYTIENDD